MREEDPGVEKRVRSRKGRERGGGGRIFRTLTLRRVLVLPGMYSAVG